MEDILLKLDKNNQLVFSVNISATEPINESPTMRFLIEEGSVEHSFKPSRIVGNDVEFNLSGLSKLLSEGLYKGRLEVIVGDKYFCPIRINEIKCENSVKVVAEQIKRKNKEPKDQVFATIKTKNDVKIRKLSEKYS